MSIDDGNLVQVRSIDNDQVFNFQFYDMKLRTQYKDSINFYVRENLDNLFYINVESKVNNRLVGWIIYNCNLSERVDIKDEIPCSKGNLLNLELLDRGYFEYIGNNDYLKRRFGKLK